MTDLLPVDRLADPTAILALLGSFWARLYTGRAQARSLCGGAGAAAAQAQLDLRELADCLARRTVPIYHRERWRVLYLRRSARLPDVPVFGAAGVFGGAARYGEVRGPGAHAWACPLAAVGVICNRLTAPGRSLIRGLDFTLDGGVIVFRDDPFADPLLAARDVVDDAGRSVDREVALWCFAADSERGFIHEQFGHVLGVDLPSSEAYRDLVNALFDALVGGTAVEQLLAALAALTGTPLAHGDETVAHVFRDAYGLAIVTDRRAYRFPSGATPVVAPGDAVRAGSMLVDTVAVWELNDGRIPPGLTALAVGPGLLDGGYYADVTFPDRTVPLEVEGGPGRFTRVSWALGGYPPDVDRFWDEVHARGVARGQTLAHLLDIRDDPATEPDRENLPATINPLAFLISNLLRGNALLVRIRVGGLARGAPGVEQLRLLRRIIPPHACLITLIDLPPADDSVKMALGAEELDLYDAPAPTTDAVAPAALRDGPSEVGDTLEGCR
jgi:hypothetical protein